MLGQNSRPPSIQHVIRASKMAKKIHGSKVVTRGIQRSTSQLSVIGISSTSGNTLSTASPPPPDGNILPVSVELSRAKLHDRLL